MASDREIERLRKDKDGWRRLAAHILKNVDRDVYPERDAFFLDSFLSRRWGEEEPSYLQTEWLLDIRRKVEFVSTYRGYSLARLISICRENSFQLDCEDEDWIVDLFESKRTTLRYIEARRVYELARLLGEVDDWAA